MAIKSGGTYKSHYSRASAMRRNFANRLKELVGARGFEPRAPCAQGIGVYATDGGNGRHSSIDVSNITNPNRSVSSPTSVARKQT